MWSRVGQFKRQKSVDSTLYRNWHCNWLVQMHALKWATVTGCDCVTDITEHASLVLEISSFSLALFNYLLMYASFKVDNMNSWTKLV